MLPNVFLTSILGFATLASAHITGVSTVTKPFAVTSTSKIPLTFTTTTSPTIFQDFSMAVGIAPASSHLVPPSLGEGFLQNFDLVALGEGPTPHGTFTLNVTLTTDQVGGEASGQFTITTAVTRAVGAAWSTSISFFNTSATLQIPSS